MDIPTVSRWLGHKDGGALAMKRYGHLRQEHSFAMIKKVSFDQPVNVVPLPKPAEIQAEKTSAAANNRRAVAQAKAKYAYPWWASKNAEEVFWGQLNEPVQIVPPDKYLTCAKEAMHREVFLEELTDRQSIKEEFSERIPQATLIELCEKIHAKRAEDELKAS